MPINKSALIRYKTIDNCLQNRFRRWTLEDLMDACSEALHEYEGMVKGISKRTIQLDIQNMRSDKFGYNAPIIVTEKKYYSYEVKNFSITNSPVTVQDLSTLSEVFEVLKQFKGFDYFEELNGVLTRLEDKLYKQKNKGQSYIDFEKNELLKGLKFIDPLHKAIIQRKTLEIVYQSFKARMPQTFVFYPYLLKEYRNRWFVLGLKKKGRTVMVLALDRIEEVCILPEEVFEPPFFNERTFFDNVIGVTKSLAQRTNKVVLQISRENAPYVITKPLHSSQQILKILDDGIILSIDVIWNFELEREILGFGEAVKVLSPKRLAGKITSRLKQALRNYNEVKEI